MSEELRRYIIYRAIVGSRAYGLHTDESDVDRRGCYLPPARLHWSLAGVPEQLVDDDAQECYWELEKLLRLGLKANPNALETIHSPIVEHATPLADELRAMGRSFLSRHAEETYLGYADAQFRRLNASTTERGVTNWKHAMHLLRLLYAGIELAKSGELRVDASDRREDLLAVKRGEVTWDYVRLQRDALTSELEDAFKSSPLPAQPDFARVDDFLVRARRQAVDL